MNMRQALARSPIKQAVHDEGNGLRVVVTRQESGYYEVVVTMEGSVYLSETVLDEQVVEHVLWERLRMLSILFEPAQSPSFSSSPPFSLKPNWLAFILAKLLLLFSKLNN